MKNEKKRNDYFEMLYKLYYNDIFYFVNLLTNSTDETEEVIHDLFVNIMTNNFDSKIIEKRTRNYLITAAKNIAINRMRKTQTNKKYIEKQKRTRLEKLASNENPVEQDAFDDDTNQILNREINSFPERNRCIFIGYISGEFNINELTEIYEVSRFKIRSIITRCENAIRDALTGYV